MEKPDPLTVILLLLTVYVGGVTTQNPGVQIRLTEKGIDKVARVAVDHFDNVIENAPPMNFSSQSENLNLSFTGLRVGPQNFQKPISRVQISSLVGVVWMTSGAAFTITGRWGYWYRPIPALTVFLTDTGTISIRCTDIAFNISLKLGKDEDGRPFIHSTKCQPSIKTVRITVNSEKGGDVGTVIYNAILSAAQNDTKKQAESLLCNSATMVLNSFNTQLAKLEVMSQVADGIVLDYSLISTPEFRDGHITTKHKGEYRTTVFTDPAFQFSPAMFPSQTVPPRMINIWVSDTVFNSFAFAIFNRGRLNTNITNVQTSDTNCHHSVMCIGTLFPQLKDDYPESMGYLHLSATKPPVFRTSPSGTNLHLDGDISAYLCTQSASLSQVFKLKMVLNMSIVFNPDGNVLKGTANTFGLTKINPIFSEIKNLHSKDFENLYKEYIREHLERDLNEIGKAGLTLPQLPGLRLVNAVVTHFEGGLMLAADVQSAPLIPRPTTPNTRTAPREQFMCRTTTPNSASGHRVYPGGLMLIVIILLLIGKDV